MTTVKQKVRSKSCLVNAALREPAVYAGKDLQN